jgi:hypothetical protein
MNITIDNLKITAELLGCEVKTATNNGVEVYALFDTDLCGFGLQCTPFLSLSDWQGKNEAQLMLNYLQNNLLN